ncbi:hypothetical protein [Streptomyces sp. cg35]|uniref:hypothetical protein n=1 Tax=Streptomyces sp. cg35 TaxID=3421650 RepID=UPI003D169D0F
MRKPGISAADAARADALAASHERFHTIVSRTLRDVADRTAAPDAAEVAIMNAAQQWLIEGDAINSGARAPEPAVEAGQVYRNNDRFDRVGPARIRITHHEQGAATAAAEDVDTGAPCMVWVRDLHTVVPADGIELLDGFSLERR